MIDLHATKEELVQFDCQTLLRWRSLIAKHFPAENGRHLVNNVQMHSELNPGGKEINKFYKK